MLADGTIEGFVGGTCAESTVRAQSLSLLDSGESLLLRIPPEEEAAGPRPGVRRVPDRRQPVPVRGHARDLPRAGRPGAARGGGGRVPIAVALVDLAPPGRAPGGPAACPGTAAAVVVASHGRDEEDALVAAPRGRRALRRAGRQPQAGRSGGRRAGRGRRGPGPVHTPAGLDIGAAHPEEVALSILAEIVALRPPTLGTASGRPPVASRRRHRRARHRHRPGVRHGRWPPSTPSLHLDHDGERYWFCGSGCLRAFAADPARYLRRDRPGPRHRPRWTSTTCAGGSTPRD